MGDRRMFAKTIVLSDAFLDMPSSARCLYFTLGMFADDDGFVNSPKGIMRQCGATDGDMQILLDKKFVLLFESGVIVIKHWRIHNYIQKDRYKPTKYKEEMALLTTDENGGYKMDTNCIQPVSKMDTQVKLSKVKLSQDKNTIVQNPVPEVLNEQDVWFEKFWKEYPKKQDKKGARKSFGKFCKTEDDFEKIMNGLTVQKNTTWKGKDLQYIPMPTTWLNGNRWEDEPVQPKQQMGFDDLPF